MSNSDSSANVISAINNLNETTKQMNHLMTLTYQNNHNPYAVMAHTTDSQKYNVRQVVFLPYSGITDNEPICMYTQIKDKTITASHILPKSTKMSTLNNLRINPTDINSPKNLLWICPGIEDAFDSMQLSFTPVLTLGLVQKYRMVIWDPSCLNKELIPKSNQFLRDFYREDRYLDFTIIRTDGTTFEHSVYKRLLANQAMWSYYYKNGIYRKSVWIDGDFSSLNEDELRNLVEREYVNGSIKIINEEISDSDDEGI